MAVIDYHIYDQTLYAVDAALKRLEDASDRGSRIYLGMSQIGEECERKLFYGFRKAAKRENVIRKKNSAGLVTSGLLTVYDGYDQESKMADRLRLIPGIRLHTQQDDQQIAFDNIDGHFRGHCDGMILGLLENSSAWHVWEHKSVNQKKFNLLLRLRARHGEKKSLEKWDEVYYSQAQIYMSSANLARHYLTVSTPGGRDYLSIRTHVNARFAELLLRKAHRIIYAKAIPAKLSEKPEYYKCKLCDYSKICQHGKAVDKSCGTCRALEIKPNRFYCDKLSCDIDSFTACQDWVSNVIFEAPDNKQKKPSGEKKAIIVWDTKEIGK